MPDSRPVPGEPARRRHGGLGRAAAAGLAVLLGAQPAMASTQILYYDVDHPWLGKIGTYVNDIVRQGSNVTVTSTMRVAAAILGIVVHREDADRVERWTDGRLVYFNGVTTINGKPVAVHGTAQGNGFVVTSPHGTITAPADVATNNPRSCSFIRRNMIFAVNTGTIEPGHVTGGEAVMLQSAGGEIWTRHYRIESVHTHAQVWLDQRCVPVKMSVVISGTDISMPLTHETDLP